MRLARFDGRASDELRAVRIVPGFQKHAEGSAMIELGETMVLCSVSVENRVPAFLKGSGTGWITAEYFRIGHLNVVQGEQVCPIQEYFYFRYIDPAGHPFG